LKPAAFFLSAVLVGALALAACSSQTPASPLDLAPDRPSLLFFYTDY